MAITHLLFDRTHNICNPKPLLLDIKLCAKKDQKCSRHTVHKSIIYQNMRSNLETCVFNSCRERYNLTLSYFRTQRVERYEERALSIISEIVLSRYTVYAVLLYDFFVPMMLFVGIYRFEILVVESYQQM